MKEIVGYMGNHPIFVDHGPMKGISAPMTTGFRIEQTKKPGRGEPRAKRKTLSARVKHWGEIEKNYKRARTT